MREVANETFCSHEKGFWGEGLVVEGLQKRIKIERSKQVLNLLKQHGPMSSKIIGKLIDPPMTNRRLYEVLQRLQQKEMIRNLNRSGTRFNNFFQIRQEPHLRNRIAKYLKCDAASIKQKQFRFIMPGFNEAKVYWRECLKVYMPNLEIIHDIEIQHHELAKKLIPFDFENKWFQPHLLILVHNDDGTFKTIVCFFDCMGCSREKFQKLLYKLIQNTSIDGLLYICDNECSQETFRNFYSNYMRRILKTKNRIPERFFAITHQQIVLHTKNLKVLDYKGGALPMNQWIHQL